MSKTMIAALESLIYEGIRDLNRSCPAVSQSYNLTVDLSSKFKVLEMKSIPTVGYSRLFKKKIVVISKNFFGFFYHTYSLPAN